MAELQARIERAVEIMRAAVASGENASAVMGAASTNEVLFVEAAPSVDGKENPDGDSIWLLASITKTFFGTAFMQLAEAGKLLLNDPVVTYIPEFGVNGKKDITIWNLLTHTAGLCEDAWLEVYKRGGTTTALIQAECSTWLNFKPGTAWEYNNGSFWILGELITRISGQPYPEYLREHICAPLGMNSTAFSFTGKVKARMMPVHTWETEGLVSAPNALEYLQSTAFGAGGLWSSCYDLLAYCQAHLNALAGRQPALVSAPGTRMMTKRHTANVRDVNGAPAWYGLAWGTDDGAGFTLGRGSGFGHGSAASCYLWIEPEADLAFVYLTNMWAYPRRASQLALNVLLSG
ncbi:MAG: beta-lactamase family protein [Chloroflexi bacterium]|nr:beta-lactamase family protein [Chloroflexota bacterium]